MNAIVFCSSQQEYLPQKQTPGSVCRDLFCAKQTVVHPGAVFLVSTGVKIAFPQGRHAKMYARSSLPLKYGLTLANGVAVMDTDYRGEYLLQLLNTTKQDILCEEGKRLAQLEICRTYGQNIDMSSSFPEIQYRVGKKVFDTFEEVYPTQRGGRRFGSTGG